MSDDATVEVPAAKQPIVAHLETSLEMEPEAAEAVLSFVREALLQAQQKTPEATRGVDLAGLMLGETDESRAKPGLGSLIALAGGGQMPSAESLLESGLAQDLASKAGIDVETAVEALQQVLALLAGQEPPKPRKRPRKKPTATKPAATKPAAKKPKAKKTTKSTAKKPATKKPAAKKTTKKSAAKKPAAKKTAKKSTAKKPAATKTAKKSTAKKPAATKTARKSTAKKPAATKTARKSTAKKPAATKAKSS